MIARLAGIPAIALFALPASAQDDCDEWNTRRFFHTATVETVAACLEAGADVNARSESAVPFGAEAGYTPLHFAALDSADPAVIALLLAAGADVAARNRRGETPLHGAARLNHSVAVVEELVRAGADLDARDREGNTPLHVSRLIGHPPVIHLLLELGADPTLVNDAGEVADPVDCDHWNTQAFARIATAEATAACLAAGADANARNENGDMPLLLATSHPGGGTPGAPASGNPAVVRVLLEAGADVNASDRNGSTALINAAGGKLVETTRGGMFGLAENSAMVAALLAAGADVNGGSGSTPLHQAAFAEDLESVRMLLDAGADVHARDWRQRTPLLNAADYGGFRNLEVLETLIEAGADVNDRDEFGKTVLDFALASPADRVVEVVSRLLDLGADGGAPGVLLEAAGRGDNPELIAILLAAGADVNAPGRSPLHGAAFGGGPEVIAALVAGGGVVDARDGGGRTPLHVAIDANRPDNVAALIEEGADVHAPSGDGDTPLHRAARWPSMSRRWKDDPPAADTLTVVALVAAGVDVDARNDHGETPLHVAMRSRHHPVADKLLALGADPLAVDHLGRVPRPVVCDWTINQFFQSTPWRSVLGCLQAGADVRARGEDGETPLHGLARDAPGGTRASEGDYPYARIIAAFMEAGADVNARDRGGGTPLHNAVSEWGGDEALAAALLDAGAEVNARDGGGATPLHRAAGVGWRANDSIVSLLVNAGADLHATDDGGRTALHMALRSDDPVVVAGLIELGADTGARDDSGIVADPLDCARFSTATFFHLASAQVVAGCIERGADVNARVADSLGEASPAPLHQASGWARDPAIITLLLRAGAEVNATAAGATPLHQAARRADDPAIVTVLVEAGAELEVWTPGIHTPYGYTPLHSAVGRNRNPAPAVVAALIEAGADIHARQEDGPTPLHDARSPEAVALLLEAGADIEARATFSGWRSPIGHGMTPLHVAAKRGDAAVFMALLAAGADPEALDADGGTPMDYAGEQEALRELEVVKRWER